MTEIVRSQVATAPDTRIACVRSYESKAALMRELSVTVLIGRPETTHNSSCLRWEPKLSAAEVVALPTPPKWRVVSLAPRQSTRPVLPQDRPGSSAATIPFAGAAPVRWNSTQRRVRAFNVSTSVGRDARQRQQS
jgi:hypothetical protein